MAMAASFRPKGFHGVTPHLQCDHAAAEDQFWGDRAGAVLDPAGYVWWIATRKEDLTKEEVEQRAEDFFAKMPQPVE